MCYVCVEAFINIFKHLNEKITSDEFFNANLLIYVV